MYVVTMFNIFNSTFHEITVGVNESCDGCYIIMSVGVLLCDTFKTQKQQHYALW